MGRAKGSAQSAYPRRDPSGVCFYGVEGSLLAACGGESPDYDSVYFAGKLIWEEEFPSSPRPVVPDRLGSIGAKYFPYGQEASSTWAEHNKFATYFQDSTTNLSYARNRYYSSTLARFTTPDRYRASGGPADPQSWNRYAYVQNDPVNANDPSGLAKCYVEVPYGEPIKVPCPSSNSSGFCNLNPLDPFCRPGSMGSKGDPGIADTPDGVAVSSLDDIPPADLARAYLLPAEARAIQAVTLNPDCMNLFGNAMTRQAGFNPANVLASIVSGGRFGSITFEDEGSRWGVAEARPAGWLRVPGLAGSVSITINTYNDANLYWNDGNTDENARTLLHELAHAFNFMRGSGGFAIGNRTEGVDKHSFDKIIEEKCIPKN